MKNIVRQALAPALLSLAFVATYASAQTTPASAPDAASGSHARRHADYIEQRLNTLHAQLKITDQQSQQWDAYAQVVRDNAHSTDAAFRDRARQLPTLNADDAMKSYASIAQLHAENMQKLSTAFSALYASLSDDQKQTADELFRNERARRHGAASHRHAAPAAASAPAPASN
ncbi:hypothetical protein CY652_08425 [Burkholderia sp. WAC0059]|uniref:Spy/CpxP family protein refolding chaperone n=1 Tax=Burkholderia sp. WAC0059 TaxID=2066022 RepID=UPI000C7EE3B8|nr:Spy/CpxP family protein refolding chaperone [Burkholderia sp. WAC0059]PLZ02930.1 hypothetical protein CY652_08425 [Burkholderia sp. WAC0059]